MSNVTISEDLLNHMVDALTYLPYRQVQGIFEMMTKELQEQQEKDKPQLITR